MQRIGQQEGKDIPQLIAVKQAIMTIFSGSIDIIYDEKYEDFIVKFADGEQKYFTSLSDGQRSLLGLAGDIAYRMALLNPHLLENVCQTNGIVLIDELDLHLHPKWQREIVKNLKSAFPNIQFFATTHSPFIIQSVNEKELIDLNETPHASQYVGQSIEDITENIMGVNLPQISKRKQDMIDAAEAYYTALDNPDNLNIESLQAKLDELMEPFADDPAYVALLRMERHAKLGS